MFSPAEILYIQRYYNTHRSHGKADIAHRVLPTSSTMRPFARSKQAIYNNFSGRDLQSKHSLDPRVHLHERLRVSSQRLFHPLREQKGEYKRRIDSVNINSTNTRGGEAGTRQRLFVCFLHRCHVRTARQTNVSDASVVQHKSLPGAMVATTGETRGIALDKTLRHNPGNYSRPMW